MENIGKPKYAVIDSGLFGVKIIAGIVTGIRYTENKPVYEISFGKDRWWTSKIAENFEEIMAYFELATLDRIRETHGLKIKFKS